MIAPWVTNSSGFRRDYRRICPKNAKIRVGGAAGRARP